MERAPASRLGIVAIDEAGNRREWHFGELIARSAGLSGAMAARGVERGDAVMTLIGSRIEWVLAMLACFRMGAVAMPCHPQLRRKDLALRIAAANPKLCVGQEELFGELPAGVQAMTLADVAAALDEDLPQETPADVGGPGRRGPRGHHLHLGHNRRSPRCGLSAALPPRSAPAGRALVRRHRWASSPGARPRQAGRSRPATSSSPPGWRARRRCSTMRASTPSSAWRPSSGRESTSSARHRPSTGCSPSGPS